MLIRRALYEMQYNKVEKARAYVNKIKTALPDFRMPRGIETALGEN